MPNEDPTQKESADLMPPGIKIHYYDNRRDLISQNPTGAQTEILKDLEESAPTGNLLMRTILIAFSLLEYIGLQIPRSAFMDKFLRAKSLEPMQIQQAVRVIKATNSQETYKEALEAARQNYPQLGL